jgi:hypothetical protein
MKRPKASQTPNRLQISKEISDKRKQQQTTPRVGIKDHAFQMLNKLKPKAKKMKT